MSDKFQETVYDEKKSHICSGINLFELHCWQFIQTVELKNNLAINFKYLAYHCKFRSYFV